MTGAISQMQMLYVPEEDRILFRVNSADQQEFRFWLTRRYAILMLKVLKAHIDADPDVSLQEDPQAKAAIRSFKQEQAMQQANFKEQFQEGEKEMPLGDEVPLAFKINYRLEGENLHLGVQPKAGQGINLAINRQINSSLTQLILTAARKAEWRLAETNLATPVPDDRVVN